MDNLLQIYLQLCIEDRLLKINHSGREISLTGVKNPKIKFANYMKKCYWLGSDYLSSSKHFPKNDLFKKVPQMYVTMFITHRHE